jgi:hypothetical protein
LTNSAGGVDIDIHSDDEINQMNRSFLNRLEYREEELYLGISKTKNVLFRNSKEEL